MSPLPIRRILFPTDFSTCAEGAYRHAAWLADRFGAELHVLLVIEDEAAPERDWPEAAGTGLVRISLADVCADLGLPLPPPADGRDPHDLVEVVEAEVVGRNAPEAILDYVHDEEIDLVVLGTHGRRGWRRGMLGSVAEAVARRAPCPVLTVRPLDAPGEAEWPPSRVLLAVDAVGDEDAVPVAARWAAGFSVAYQAPLELVHVTSSLAAAIGGLAVGEGEAERARASLLQLADALRAETGSDLPVTVTVRTGDPADVVRTVAEEVRTHLLVVGTSGRSGPGRAILGSVAEDLVRTAPCPVLVARDALLESGEEKPPHAQATPAINTPHDAYPLTPHHAAVVDGAHVTLRWEPAADAERYAVEVAEDPEFIRVVLSQEVSAGLTELALPVPFPGDDRTLYWRVSVGVGEAWSEGARIESFTSGTADQVGHFTEPDEAEPFGPLPSLLGLSRRRRPR